MEIAGNRQTGRLLQFIRWLWNGPEELVPQVQKGYKAENFAWHKAIPEQKTEGTEVEPKNMMGSAVEPDKTTGAPAPETDPMPSPEPAPQHTSSEPKQEPKAFQPAVQSNEATVIAKGTVISGSIKSASDIEMYGEITGNITTTGNVLVSGKQTGDIQGAGINLFACTVRGNLSAANSIKVDSESVVIGDIKCGELTFDGKLKGNVHVMGNVNCKSNALVVGDITATTITVDSGAKLQGKIQITDGSSDKLDIPDFAKDAPAK